MISINQSLFGGLCLIGAIVLTFAWPLGRERRSHVISALVIVALFVIGLYNLIPVTWVSESETWKVILAGLVLGGLAVLYRDIRRFARFFHGKVYRMTHPYYWYGRYYRRRRY